MQEANMDLNLENDSEKIQSLRQSIDQIDKEISNLLEARLDLAREIGALKAKDGVPILDEKREEKVIEHLLVNIRNSSLAPAMMRIYEKIMDESKQVQKD